METPFSQLFVKLFDNKTLTIQFPTKTPTSLQSIKQQIQSLTEIPIHLQKLTLNGKFLNDTTSISPSFSRSTLHLNISLLGGKGGFGSLLRGAATKAGQKKTNNFDACRDMSGRRLRHVNAEKKLEEWRAEEEERKLEKVAEDYMKKMMKEKKKKGGGDGSEKYVQKYREVSARCIEEVERSVRESLGDYVGGKKRKLMEKLEKKAKAEGSDAKKLKIWMGKRTMGESDIDDTDDDDDDDESDKDDAENETSVVIDNGNGSDSNKDIDGSSGSESVEQLDGVCSGPEEEREAVAGERVEPSGSPSGVISAHLEGNGLPDPSSECEEQKTDQNDKTSESDSYSQGTSKVEIAVASVTTESMPAVAEVKAVAEAEVVANDEKMEVPNDGKMEVSENIPVVEHPLKLDDFSSAAELEVLGMDRLKSELQAHGLKCGGTLKERAARLFLLKTTPIDKLPKKLLAKK